ncbi:MAG: hypothetical protein QW292_05305 [Candidatus Parvarchaeota archaeon]
MLNQGKAIKVYDKAGSKSKNGININTVFITIFSNERFKTFMCLLRITIIKQYSTYQMFVNAISLSRTIPYGDIMAETEKSKTEYNTDLYRIGANFENEIIELKCGSLRIIVKRAEAFVYYSTFVVGEYNKLQLRNDDLVIDAGASIGDFTIKAAKK